MWQKGRRCHRAKIVDVFSDIIIDSFISIAPFLREEFGVINRADNILVLIFFRVMQGADPFVTPSILFFIIKDTSGEHFQIGLTDSIAAFRISGLFFIVGSLCISGIDRDSRFSMEGIDDIIEDRCCIIDAITHDSFNVKMEFMLEKVEDRNKHG